MKKFKYIFFFTILAMGLNSCEDFLEEKSKNSATAEYLQSTTEGIQSECIALYSIDRSVIPSSESTLYSVLMDRGTDIDVFRGGGGATFFRYDNLHPTNGDVSSFWQHQYRVIGKTNEIIEACRKIDLSGIAEIEKRISLTKMLRRSYGEATLFRARAYLQLLERFDRINLDTTVVTIDNVNTIKFKPADPEDVMKLIYQDIDSAIVILPWIHSDEKEGNRGRFTRGVAKHLKAKAAMWKNDWDEAIIQVDDIENDGPYKLLYEPKNVFEGPNLIHTETIFAHQFARERGGGAAHRMSLIYTPIYDKIPGFKRDLSLGGYGWGRSYPNAYLISLYDKVKDVRYKQFFKHSNEWVYIFPDLLPRGKTLGEEATVSNTLFMETKHTSSLKYFDKWTKLNADETGSYKDVIVYRLAETFLLGAEAYMRKNGGGDPKALYYYNKTWMRAGNDEFRGVLTEDIILDEHARELHLEGSRFEILKRTGKLLERVRAHGGEIKSEAISNDFTQPRKNIQDYHVRWPIPQSEIDQMGGQSIFPQNDGYQK